MVLNQEASHTIKTAKTKVIRVHVCTALYMTVVRVLYNTFSHGLAPMNDIAEKQDSYGIFLSPEILFQNVTDKTSVEYLRDIFPIGVLKYILMVNKPI